MDVARSLSMNAGWPISCVEMHTTGEPIRIVCHGYPELNGTLLEQRAEAKCRHDIIRQRLMFEPRGHSEMYGAILRPVTELVTAGLAHIGVLFCHIEGYSMMCGHATIALGRLLIDTYDLSFFPRRNDLVVDDATRTTKLLLHVPCGIVEVTVPVSGNGEKSDPSRPVSFLSVPSFATAWNYVIDLPDSHQWPELRGRSSVMIDIAYGGAFYALISASELGFPDGLNSQVQELQIDAMSHATKLVKSIIMKTPGLREKVVHPDSDDLSYLYSVMIVDDRVGEKAEGTNGVETGLCFFANQQVDRSPTGSCVAARVAVGYMKTRMAVGDSWTYHSVVSNAFGGEGSFIGRLEKVVKIRSQPHIGVIVKTEGKAWYTGTSVFVVENWDRLGERGFNFKDILNSK